MTLNVTYWQWLVLVVVSGAVTIALIYGAYRAWRNVGRIFSVILANFPRRKAWLIIASSTSIAVLVAAYPVYYVVTMVIWPILRPASLMR